MNGIHDMGGMEGFGPVRPEPNEPPFHSKWEARCLAMNRAMGYAKVWNIDESRAAIEQLPPLDYLGMSVLREMGVPPAAASAQAPAGRCRRIRRRSRTPPRQGTAAQAAARRRAEVVDAWFVCAAAAHAAQFKVGDRVRTKNIHPHTHTRLPRYARDRVGMIECVRGYHVFPNSLASGKGEDPQWLYTVLFKSRELWGESADPTMMLSIEAWEPYLDAATMIDPAAAKRATEAVSQHSARRRRAGVSRAVGSAGFCHGVGAARTRSVHVERMGGDHRRRDQARAGRPAIPTPARPIIPNP